MRRRPTSTPSIRQYGAPLTPRVSYLNQELWQRQLGIYAQDQMRFADGWLVTLNGRYDWAELESHDGPTFYAPTQDFDQERERWPASGRAGLAYEFANGLTPYVSVATFFNPIIGTDALTGELFKPEEGVQYEVGFKYAPTFIDGLFTVSLFDLTRAERAVQHQRPSRRPRPAKCARAASNSRPR